MTGLEAHIEIQEIIREPQKSNPPETNRLLSEVWSFHPANPTRHSPEQTAPADPVWVRDWGSWISDVGGAFKPQILHNCKLQLGNTGVFLSLGDSCKPYLAFLSSFQCSQHRKEKLIEQP